MVRVEARPPRYLLEAQLSVQWRVPVAERVQMALQREPNPRPQVLELEEQEVEARDPDREFAVARIAAGDKMEMQLELDQRELP